MSIAGINVIGRFLTTVGSTIAGLAVVEALRAQNVPLAMLSLEDTLGGRPPDAIPSVSLVRSFADLPYKHTLFLDSILMLPKWMHVCRQELPDHHFATVVYWELDYLPLDWRETFVQFQTLYAPTAFVQAALMRSYGIHAPLIPVVPLHAVASTATVRPSKPFTFFLHFDVLSTLERKNPSAVIAAFLAAFGSRRDVRLVVKVWDSTGMEIERQQFYEITQAHPAVTFLFEHYSYAQTLALIRDADAYVSLHRTEGLGLGTLEAMSFGKPVIATDYAGGRDFLDAFNGLPIPYRLVPVTTEQNCYQADVLGAQAYWAEPDMQAAISAMQRLVDDPALYARLSYEAKARYERRKAEFLQLRWLEALLPPVAEVAQSVLTRQYGYA